MTSYLKDKVTLITGASQGIGLAVAAHFAKAGAKVVATSRSQSRAEAAVAEMPGAVGMACEVGSWESVQALVARVEREVGLVDILVNNAGTIDPLSLLHKSEPEAWAGAVATNLLGPYHLMRAVMPGMVERNSGTVVNMSSGAANSDLPGWSHYCATKAGAKKLTEVAARELREAGIDGVRVVGLSPGTVATPMMEKIRDSRINVVSNIPWERHIGPDEVAQAVAWLCGPEGEAHKGTDFSIKTPEGRSAVGLPPRD